MDEGKFFQDLARPLFFEASRIGIALDNYDIADPHRRADEFDDKHTAPLGNQALYDTSTSTPIKLTNLSLTEFPDVSDEVMSDYKIQKMLGKDIEVPTFVDLDTSPNYVQFIKNTANSLAESALEFTPDDRRA